MVYRGLLVAKRTARPIVLQLEDNRSAMAKDEGVPRVQFPGVPIEAGLHGSNLRGTIQRKTKKAHREG